MLEKRRNQNSNRCRRTFSNIINSGPFLAFPFFHRPISSIYIRGIRMFFIVRMSHPIPIHSFRSVPVRSLVVQNEVAADLIIWGWSKWVWPWAKCESVFLPVVITSSSPPLLPSFLPLFSHVRIFPDFLALPPLFMLFPIPPPLPPFLHSSAFP
jgi:hypothetical protein